MGQLHSTPCAQPHQGLDVGLVELELLGDARQLRDGNLDVARPLKMIFLEKTRFRRLRAFVRRQPPSPKKPGDRFIVVGSQGLETRRALQLAMGLNWIRLVYTAVHSCAQLSSYLGRHLVALGDAKRVDAAVE
jgi:hypothetical protein